MDPRKQKRLGPAPIASFEKSFEDNTATAAATTSQSAPTGSQMSAEQQKQQQQGQQQDSNNYSEGMESKESNTKPLTTTTTTTITTTSTPTSTTTTITTATNPNSKDTSEPQHQPSISVVAECSKSRSSTDGNSIKRPPPLKATATSTLVSSGELLLHHRGITTLATPSTPRIELSRASSSSHHEDSRDSSPENVFDQVGTGTLQETIGLGFREEGALELRSSTEELYFMDPEQKKEEQEKLQQQAKRSSPHIFKFDEHQNYLQQHQRKDSASSEVAALLCISGRTSRISSVGSQGSAVSRLSAVSGVSRSPSPHRMLLETSFCGPKPLGSMVDGRAVSTGDPPTTELLEQMLLARKHDPTQAVLAEGIKLENSPKKKPTSLSNGNPKLPSKIATQSRPTVSTGATAKTTMGAQRRSTKSPGQMVVGKTPSGTEYIRINLKPDYMYDDKGIAPHERVVEAPNTLAPVYSRSSAPQKKPGTLSLGRGGVGATGSVMDEHRLTPTASPKPSRHGALAKDAPHGSRSPSPATVSVSRKSSFSSLFRFGGGGKDSPDSPRERARVRSKSKERQLPQSQNVTPSKQKSVLAIFKTGKRGSSAGATDAKSSKSSSPIDGGHEVPPPPPHPQQNRSKSHTPVSIASTGSRPASRLRYYDEPVEGYIHIPLHTPPEERETRKVLQGIQQLNAEPARPVSVPITASQLAAAAAALKPVGARKDSVDSRKEIKVRTDSAEARRETAGVLAAAAAARALQRIENLDAIHTLPQEDDDNKERTWSLEVQRHSSQDSQETVGSEASYASAIRVGARSQLAGVKEHVAQENGVAAEIHRLPSLDSTQSTCEANIIQTVATVNSTGLQQEDIKLKEKRRLLFATRLGSGSQEQIFSTQFSISKTESLSSQLSEQQQDTIAESPGMEHLQRQDTVIRRTEEELITSSTTTTTTTATTVAKAAVKRYSSVEVRSEGHRQKSVSTSEDEKPALQSSTVAAVVMRRKESNEEPRRKSRSTSEEDVDAGGMSNQRHSRYLEHFDVRKKYHEQVPRKPKRQSVSEAASKVEEAPVKTEVRKPVLPQPPPPSTAPTPTPPASVTGSRTVTPTRARSQSQSPDEQHARHTPTKPPRTSTPTRRTHVTTPPTPSKPSSAAIFAPQLAAQFDRQSMHSTDEPVESSESERDSDKAAAGSSAATAVSVTGASGTTDPKRRHLPHHIGIIEDHESTGLVSQESFDDELPYIPTTLPEERAHGVSLIPMKERVHMELKTCPVERPRSTTPLNPSHLEEYCGIMTGAPTTESQLESKGATLPVRGEKLRISLPRKDSTKERPQSAKSPRRTSNTASGSKSWFEFAEEGLRAVGNLERKDSNKQLLPQSDSNTSNKVVSVVSKAESKENVKANNTTTPTTTVTTTITTTTKGATHSTHSTQRKLSGHWIDFENIPEKRKPPKRITTLPREVTSGGRSAAGIHHHAPHHHHAHTMPGTQPDVTVAAVAGGSVADGKLHYNYVKPEDCQCECHETKRESSGATGSATGTSGGGKSITSVDLLQQGEDMLPLLEPEGHDGIEPSDSSREYSCYTDDEVDVPIRQSGSSRSKSSSSKMDEFPRRDVAHSPRNRKFPDNRK